MIDFGLVDFWGISDSDKQLDRLLDSRLKSAWEDYKNKKIPIKFKPFTSKRTKNIMLEDYSLNNSDEGMYELRIYFKSSPNKYIQKLVDDILQDVKRNTKVQFVEANDYHDAYYVIYNLLDRNVSSLKAKFEEKIGKATKISVVAYEKRWTRGDRYRIRFLRYNYLSLNRCAYCGKKVSINPNLHISKVPTLEVDHIIPVDKLMYDKKTADGISYRELAKQLGITRADSPFNLVASCPECNKKKGTNVAGYIKKGYIFGKHPRLWSLIIGIRIIVPIILFALFVMCVN